MIKCFGSEKGGTLMLVFGFIIMISFVLVPLAMSTNIGLLQAKTNANTEKSFTEAHSGMTIFARLYEEMKKGDESRNTAEVISELILQVNNMPQLDVDVKVVMNSANKPIAVTFESDAGIGNQVRTSKVRYNLEPLYIPPATPGPIPTPTPSPTPVPTTTPPVLTVDQKVLLKNTTAKENNKLFAACYYSPATGEPLPPEHFLNEFNDTQFQGWFGSTADYYLNNASSAIRDAFQNVFTDNRFQQVAALDSMITATNELSKWESGSAINHPGKVNISGSPTTEITKDTVIEADQSGNSLVANGDLEFKDIVNAQMLFKGDVRVGGNMIVREVKNAKSISFNKNVLVKGNVTLGSGGTIDTIVVEGDLIVGGNLTFSNTLKKLVVKGDLIVNGTININYPISIWQVNGGIVVKGNIIATNGVTSFDIKRSVAVQGNMIFYNPVAEQVDGVQGLFSVGGSLKVNGQLDFWNTVYGFQVGENVIVSKSLIFHSTINKDFLVQGSILVKGDLTLKNTVYDFNVLGNLVTEGSFIVGSTLERTFSIGGSLVAKGDIGFQNTVKEGTIIKIGENLITKSNLKFNDWTLKGSLEIGNMLLVFKDATFQDMNKTWTNNQMKGFYVGGTTKFNDEYAKGYYVTGLVNGTNQERICIK